jgi:hypothetical protein
MGEEGLCLWPGYGGTIAGGGENQRHYGKTKT